MSYIINNSRGQIVAVVGDGTINTTATDLALIGRAVVNYGEYQNENYVYLLENFANGSAPVQPILGQLWYNSAADTINAYSTANTWTALASQTYVDSQKISPAFTGVPTAPTATAGTTTTQIATTAFVANSPQINSPQFSGTPTAPTASNGTSTTQIATTAYVQNQLSSSSGITTAGNVTGGNLLTSGLVSAVGNVTGGNIVTAGSITVAGDVTGGNLLSSGAVSVTGNINTAGEVSATGNVIGANFIGNVIPPAGGAVSTTGNVTGGNILTSGLISAGGNLLSSGLALVTGNITGGNITTSGVMSAAGNITSAGTVIADTVIANNVITSGSTSAFRLPNLNQTQINALTPQNGDLVYNTTDNLPQVYQNGSWNNFTISYYS